MVQKNIICCQEIRLYILKNSGTVDKTTDCHNVRAPMSDHRGCLIHIKFTEVIEVVMDIGD